MAAAADLRSLPPGYRFVPKEKELVEFYLLPRARGLPDPFPGVDITDDDTAASTQPWKLFKRHNRKEDDEPYFFVRSGDTKAGARQDRLVDGGFKWKSQRRVPGVLEVGGEKIKWTKHILSLQHGDGDGGSLGWVMHEYTITEPHYASVKICHISFTGHGQKRKRIPDGYDDCESERESQRARVDATPLAPTSNQETEHAFGAMDQEQLQGENCLFESAPQRLHVATAPSSSPVMTGNFDQETEYVQAGTIEYLDAEDIKDGSARSDSGTTATMLHQDSGASAHQAPSDDFIAEMIDEMTDVEGTLELNEEAPMREQQQEGVVIPLPMVQESKTAEDLTLEQNKFTVTT
ncbi:hypothetical protein EJB05_23971, partial [Eragrostis curvula]